MKAYPLEIENIGEDGYQLMSRGHHGIKEFMEAVAEAHPSWSMGYPIFTWFKAVPTRKKGYSCIYVEVEPETKGSFPVTVTYKAHGVDKWNPKILKKDTPCS